MNEMATKIERRRPDIFTDPEAHTDSTRDAIHHALLPLDRTASEMEMKWGCERLPSLVSPATAALFGSAKAKLDAAIQVDDPQEVVRRAAVMIKGWSKMDAEATEMGHEALSPDIWCHTTSTGFKVAVARSNADAIKSIRTDKTATQKSIRTNEAATQKSIRTNDRLEGVAVYSLDEIGRILEAESYRLLDTVKKTFPEAKVTKTRKKKAPAPLFDDGVPF
jgi:hypothetical protein